MVEQGIPELDVARVRRWCAQRVPDEVRDQVRIEAQVADRHITVVECRPPWDDLGGEWTALPIARLRYTKQSGLWSLYWRDRNEHFRSYDSLAPSARIDDLLSELDRDPTALFWG